MEDPYTNREIVERFNEIKDLLNRVEKQTIKTNGRVTRLESRNQYLMGVGTVIMVIIVSVAIPIMDAFIKTGKLF